jgi:heterodisulfide reductase subunit A
LKKIGKALVVGAGIGGIRTALDLADNGYGVTLIDRAPHLGGILSQLDRQFPTNRCGMCKMLPLVERDSASQFCLRKGLFHDNIRIQTATRITAVEGEPGRMKVRLRRTPTWVDGQRCVACAQCVDVCPVEVPDDFNAGLSQRRAIYRPVPHAAFDAYVIDPAACTRCGECEKVCPTGAIDLSAGQRRQFHILVVDDELVVRDSLKEWLVDEGFSVAMAESGSQALELLDAKPFHLMLTDIKMPGMDGVELLEQAKSRHPDLTVVMMTAYATVETAVEAMKMGALDYLMKPFDPEKLIPMVNRIYAEMIAGQDEELEVGAVVLAGGVDYFNPGLDKNPYGYGINPHVVAHLAFERLLSGTGPTKGRLIRPADGKPIEKIAFLQCVGSRDLQHDADFCSTACCMIAVKQAMLAREKGGASMDTTLFYMDMRAAGLAFQRLCDKARNEYQVRFERGRVHSVTMAGDGADAILRHVALDGSVTEDRFDLVVLATGQRPAADTEQSAEMAGLALNPWGFIQTVPFCEVQTDNPGIMAAGSCAGLKDISESVLLASAAAAEAGRVLHASGGSLCVESADKHEARDVSAEPPRVLVAVCTCDGRLNQMVDPVEMETRILNDPSVSRSVSRVLFVDRLCCDEGWDRLGETALEGHPNRVLVAACHPYAFISQLKALAVQLGLPSRLMEVIDLHLFHRPSETMAAYRLPWGKIAGALVRLRRVEPRPAAPLAVIQKALVVGGGIAGMQAALSIADQGYPVALAEKEERLGGNLLWLQKTIEGEDLKQLLKRMVQKVEKHPRIERYLNTTVKSAFGQVGRFYTTVETQGRAPQTLEHGVVVLATGGSEAAPQSLGYGSHPAIVTQKELESGLADARIDPGKLTAAAMILCVDSRREPRNFCSRVCCPTALKHALHIKQKNPEAAIYVLYRDMMTCGFAETYFTQARQAGMIFIPYDPDQPPEVKITKAHSVRVLARDPILTAPLEIESDLVVLATGIAPRLPAELAAAYGAQTTRDGFFQPADVKWRPVDALAQGVFACGIALAPRSVAESMTTARAAAQQALHILTRPVITVDRVVAQIRRSLCSLCERCIEACPYAARRLNPEGDRVVVHPVMCQGCGACAATCPNGAAIVEGFTQGQMLESIDAAFAEGG